MEEAQLANLKTLGKFKFWVGSLPQKYSVLKQNSSKCNKGSVQVIPGSAALTTSGFIPNEIIEIKDRSPVGR